MSLSSLYEAFAGRLRILGASLNVTHYTLSLGDPDSDTGWYAPSYSNETIEMVIITKAAAEQLTGTGFYVTNDAVGLTKSQVSEQDKIKDAANRYYRILTVKRHYVGDVLAFYEAQLVYLPLE